MSRRETRRAVYDRKATPTPLDLHADHSTDLLFSGAVDACWRAA